MAAEATRAEATKTLDQLNPVTAVNILDYIALWQASSEKLKKSSIPLVQKLMLQVPYAEVDNADSPYTVLDTNFIIDVDSTDGDVSIVLDTSLLLAGKRYILKKTVAANTVTISTEGAETIEGLDTYVLTDINQTLSVYSDGANWKISAGSSERVLSIEVSDIDDPSTELNAIAGTVGEPTMVVCRQGEEMTLYIYDDSVSSESVPFTVDASGGGLWVAISGKYIYNNQGINTVLKSGGTIEDPGSDLSGLSGVDGKGYLYYYDATNHKGSLYAWTDVVETEHPPETVEGTSGTWKLVGGTHIKGIRTVLKSAGTLADPGADLASIDGIDGETYIYYYDATNHKGSLYAWTDVVETEHPPETVEGTSGTWKLVGGTHIKGIRTVLKSAGTLADPGADLASIDGIDGETYIYYYDATELQGTLYVWSDDGTAENPPHTVTGVDGLWKAIGGNYIPLGAFEEVGGVIRQSLPDYDEDFVVGSPQLDDDAESDHFTRMIFDKLRGFFAAGYCSTNAWDTRGAYASTLGYNTKAWGTSSTAIGDSTEAIKFGTLSTGKESKADFVGAFARASGMFGTVGDCQTVKVVCRVETTDGTTKYLTAIGDGALSPTGVLTIPTETIWKYTVDIIAINDGDMGEAMTFKGKGLIINNNGTVTIHPTEKKRELHTVRAILDAGENNMVAATPQALLDENGNIVQIPDDAIIIGAMYDVETTFTEAGDDATIKLGVKADDDDCFVAAIAINDGSNPWDAGLHGTLIGSYALDGSALTAIEMAAAKTGSYIKTTDLRDVTAEADQDISTGKLSLYITYLSYNTNNVEVEVNTSSLGWTADIVGREIVGPVPANLELPVVGEAGKTIRWAAEVTLLQITTGT